MKNFLCAGLLLIIAMLTNVHGDNEPAGDLYFAKFGPTEVSLGNLAQYTLVVKNKGNQTIHGISIRDKISPGMSFKGRENGLVLRWDNIGDLAPQEEKKFVYRLQALKVGTFVNEAFLIVGNKNVHKARSTTRVYVGLNVSMNVNQRRIWLFKVAEFEVVIANESDVSVQDIDVISTIPKGLSYVSSSPTGIFRPAKGEQLAIVEWKLEKKIAPKEEQKIILKLRGEKGHYERRAKVKVSKNSRIWETSELVKVL